MKSPAQRIFLPWLLALCLAACSSQSPAWQDEALAATPESAQQLLASTAGASPERANALRIQAAQQWLELGRTPQARESLDGVNAAILAGSPLAAYSATLARVLLDEGNPQAARSTLMGNPALNDYLPQLSPAEQVRIGEARALVFEALGENLLAARERMFMAPLASNPQRARNNLDALWRVLAKTPLPDLENTLAAAPGGDTAGWLSLAIATRKTQGDLDAQLRALTQWQEQWPNHPAARQLPAELAQLKSLASNRPREIAVLLPASGRFAAAGQAIRDGLLAAWYRANEASTRTPHLHFYDSSAGDFITLYRQAVTNGAQLVIGPLDKENLRLLFDLGTLPVPTLALNDISGYGAPPAGLYQFSLSPEQEASQVAQYMVQAGYRQVLLAYPDEAWATKPAEAFRAALEANGGRVIAKASWPKADAAPASLKAALNIERSEQRARDLQVLFSETLHPEARRRQDVDAIFLVARPETGRMVMPTLQFLYAANIPVYATSSIYSGIPNPDADRDMSRTRFCDMNWLLDPANPFYQQLRPWLSDNSTPYLRLYAMGADAYLLYPRLSQLQQSPGSQVDGYTGALHINGTRQVTRDMECAVFRNGLPTPLPRTAAGNPG